MDFRQADFITRQFCHAAHADALVEAGKGDFVGFVQHGGLWGFAFVGDGDGQRVAFNGVNRQFEPQLCQHRAAEAAQRADKCVGSVGFGTCLHAGNAVAAGVEADNGAVEQEVYAALLAQLREFLREQAAVARAVVGQLEGAGNLVADVGERGFELYRAVRIELLIGNVEAVEHTHLFLVLGKQFFVAEQVQRAFVPLFEIQAFFGFELVQQVAAVFGNPHHARLVAGIGRAGAVGGHFGEPFQLEQAAVGFDNQRRMLFAQPFECFHRHIGGGPGRGVAER